MFALATRYMWTINLHNIFLQWCKQSYDLTKLFFLQVVSEVKSFSSSSHQDLMESCLNMIVQFQREKKEEESIIWCINSVFLPIHKQQIIFHFSFPVSLSNIEHRNPSDHSEKHSSINPRGKKGKGMQP